jgi:hypothetical protein
MPFGFLIPLMLFGLAAVAIPPIIHLLNRRRFDVVDWGAMQFLHISETTRRRLLIEEILLMLLRMGLIAILVLALAGPFTMLPGCALMGSRPNRDVVLVFDGSYSMGYTGTGTGTTAQETAKEWATAFVNELAAGDSVAILQAKQQVVPVLEEPSHDLDRVRDAIQRLPPPGGGCDWPEALKTANRLLREKSQRPERDIILLTDGQRHSWADPNTLLRWELLAQQLHRETGIQPRVWVVNLDPNRPTDPPNWSLAPLRASRAVAAPGQKVTFKTDLILRGQSEYRPPHRLRLEVDGRTMPDLPRPPASARLRNGQVALSFPYTFDAPGSHLVSVIVEPDPPSGERPPGYAIKDQLPGDNRQDFALEVVQALPVLLVDGDVPVASRVRGSHFLRDALAPARDPTPSVRVKLVSYQDFQPALLTSAIGTEPNSRPRVLILRNVPQLSTEQRDAVSRFLADGGGVLVAVGERVEAGNYNEQLYRGGQGWLPARLDRIAGDEVATSQAAALAPASFFHPTLDLLRDQHLLDSLSYARFPRWWKVATPGRVSAAVPVALLSSNDPFLVERPYHSGRVLLCTVALDNSWGSNLPRLAAFAPLAHEMVYYLAGARSAEHNLQPGQPIRYRPADDATSPGTLSLELPSQEVKPVQARPWPVLYEETREPGVYRLEGTDGRTVHYVVQSDPNESNLAPCDDGDREKVRKLLPVRYENDRATVLAQLAVTDQRQELWRWFLLGVILLLCGEVWLTRRIVKNR